MKSYTYYPKIRTGLRPPVRGFVTPFFVPLAGETPARKPFMNEPVANILREEEAYKIQLAVPGLSKDQIKIEIMEDQLILSGIPGTEEVQGKLTRREFDFTGFKRTFTLHANADKTAIRASYEQGVLSVIIPDAKPEVVKINIQ